MDSSGDIRRIGHVSYDFQGEQRQWPTIAGTVRDKPRSSASLKKSAMNPQIEIKAYRSGAFRGETFEITMMYPSPTTEPDFKRPARVEVTCRPGSVLEPPWSGRNGKASIESVLPEGDGAQVREGLIPALALRSQAFPIGRRLPSTARSLGRDTVQTSGASAHSGSGRAADQGALSGIGIRLPDSFCHGLPA